MCVQDTCMMALLTLQRALGLGDVMARCHSCSAFSPCGLPCWAPASRQEPISTSPLGFLWENCIQACLAAHLVRARQTQMQLPALSAGAVAAARGAWLSGTTDHHCISLGEMADRADWALSCCCWVAWGTWVAALECACRW